MSNGTELAKAYVQIIPSARGMKQALTNAIDENIPDSSSGEKIGASLVSGIKKTIAAAGIGKIIKNSFTEGAALQQSVGGVETLFKSSADQVVKNAKNAYKTAGLSANEYMETVTSFSATLLQGLGGDTVKAAKIADKAIVAMSDNSNKFGTNMQSVMNAYMGFSKQNYTMLDNLKLGYGGTASEMARLINDSGVLGDAIEVTSETVKDVPFDKVIEAIGNIQDRLGVTGTTAKEAASTFSGSMASMRAATKNLLGALSTGEGVKEATDRFVETARTFLSENFLPMLSTILRSAGTLVAEAVRNLPQLIVDVIKGLSFEDGATLTATAFGLFFLKRLKNYFSSGAGEHWSSIQRELTAKFEAQGEPIGMSLGSKICAGIGAFMAGWQIGSWIYEKWGKQIDENFLHPLYDKITGKGPEEVEDAKTDAKIMNIASNAIYGNDWELWAVQAGGKKLEDRMAADAKAVGLSTDIGDFNGRNKIVSTINLPSSQWGKDLTDNLAGGILANSAVVTSAAASVAGSIKKNIGFSEPEEGPLSDFHTYAPDMMQLFAQGISENRHLVEDEVMSLVGGVKKTMTEPLGIGKAIGADIQNSSTVILKLVDGAGRLIAEGTVGDIDQLQGAEVIFSERRLA